MERKFGFFTEALDFECGDIKISTLPETKEINKTINKSHNVHKDIIYGPQLQLNRIEMNRENNTEERSTIQLPFRSYIFSLPNTHIIKSKKIKDERYIDFLIWVLSFFVGVRLTIVATKNGFISYAPIKRCHLTNFFCNDLGNALDLGRKFWRSDKYSKVNSKNLVSAIHNLYIMQKPYQLQLPFEEFIYSYIALDTCYSIVDRKNTKKEKVLHNERVEWMCKKLKIKVPDWAECKKKKGSKKKYSKLSVLRNKVFHEGLYADAPLGYNAYKNKRMTSITYEMRNLVCRLVAAILGVQDTNYLKKEVSSRVRSSIRIRSKS